MKVIAGIALIAASVFIMVVLFVVNFIITANYIGSDWANLWQYFEQDLVFSLTTGGILTVAFLMFFPLLIGTLLVYRGWKGEIK